MLYAESTSFTSYSGLHAARAVAMSSFADLIGQAADCVMAQAHVTDADKALVDEVVSGVVAAIEAKGALIAKWAAE